jgi:hypothetical protein
MDAVRQTLAVVFVFALLGLAIWALRRGGRLAWRLPAWPGGGRGARTLEMVERLPLTPQHALHVVRWRGRDLMVATHPQGCSVLLEGVNGEQK